MLALTIMALVLILVAARKLIGRYIRKQLRKLGKHLQAMAKAGMIWLAKMAWRGLKAAGRELRAQTTWLSTGQRTGCA